MVSIGREGYLGYAKAIFETAGRDEGGGALAPRAADHGQPTFCFSFTSDEFDIYHVNDSMRAEGWRFNGQQYPNAIHMAVTRPQTQAASSSASPPTSAEAVDYARRPPRRRRRARRSTAAWPAASPTRPTSSS